MMTMEYHNPVLLTETVDGLNIKEDGVYVDVTFGGGGHSKEILKRLGDKGRLFAFDQDLDALENTIDDSRFTLINENFRFTKRFLRFHGVKKVDGILADFGVSSHQFDVAERGFSTRFEADLDMRMNQNNKLSAYHVINEYEEEQLKQVFLQYGELRPAPEIEALKEFLLQTPELLNDKGRLSFISYHSLEDRLVKRFIRNGMFEGEPVRDMFGNFEVPLKKVNGLIVPSQEEIKINSRARSAKLRIAEKL